MVPYLHDLHPSPPHLRHPPQRHRDVEVEDVVQTLVAQALDRCPPLLDAVEALLRARTTT